MAIRGTHEERRARRANALAELAKGESLSAVAEKSGYSPIYLYSLAVAKGVRLSQPEPTSNVIHSSRNEQIRERVRAGESRAAVARAFGLSRERVRQIVGPGLAKPNGRYIAELYDGICDEEVVSLAEKYGVTIPAIRAWCREHGIRITRARRVSWTLAQQAEVEDLLREGLSHREIVERTGINRGAVYRIALESPDVPKRRCRWRPYTREEVEPLVRQGLSLAEIAAACGTSKNSMYGVLRRLELLPLPSKRPRKPHSDEAEEKALQPLDMRQPTE